MGSYVVTLCFILRHRLSPKWRSLFLRLSALNRAETGKRERKHGGNDGKGEAVSLRSFLLILARSRWSLRKRGSDETVCE